MKRESRLTPLGNRSSRSSPHELLLESDVNDGGTFHPVTNHGQDSPLRSTQLESAAAVINARADLLVSQHGSFRQLPSDDL